MIKKILLIRGGRLKTRVVERSFTALLPEYHFEILEPEYNYPDDTQMLSKDECLINMRQVIKELRPCYPDCSYYVLMRGRFDDDGSKMEECALVMVHDQDGNEGYSQAASFEVPGAVAQLVRNGESFSRAVEQVYNVAGIKEGTGYVGLLTHGVVTKEEQYFQPTVIALGSCIGKGG